MRVTLFLVEFKKIKVSIHNLIDENKVIFHGWLIVFIFAQPMHTCCLLCHREFKDWGASSPNGLPGGYGTKLADAVPALSQALLRETPGRKLADAVPSLSQSLLGEVPLWICQSCCKSVEEEERRSTQEQPNSVVKHRLSCNICLRTLFPFGLTMFQHMMTFFFSKLHSILIFLPGGIERRIHNWHSFLMSVSCRGVKPLSLYVFFFLSFVSGTIVTLLFL